MTIYPNQILAGTTPDRRGERLTKTFLESMAQSLKDRRVPLNVEHDYARRAAGYIENIRVLPSSQEGEWLLIGDVTVTAGDLAGLMNGFSVSGVEEISIPDSASAEVHLPYPHYDDGELVEELNRNAVGAKKWIRKSASDGLWANIVPFLILVLTPVWDQTYKEHISPRLKALLEKIRPLLRSKGMDTRLCQLVRFQSHDVEVHFVPSRSNEEASFDMETIDTGMATAAAFLLNDKKAQGVGVTRIVMFFNEAIDGYAFHRVDYLDGHVEHFA